MITKVVAPLLMLAGAVMAGVSALRDPSTLGVAVLFGMLLFYIIAFEFAMWLANSSHKTVEKATTGWGISSMYAHVVTASFFEALNRLSTYDRDAAEQLLNDVQRAAMKGRYDLNWMED